MGILDRFTQFSKKFIDVSNISCLASSINTFTNALGYLNAYCEFSNVFDAFQKTLQGSYDDHRLDSKSTLNWGEAIDMMSTALENTRSKIVFKPDLDRYKATKKALNEVIIAWNQLDDAAQNTVQSNGIAFRWIDNFNADHFIHGILQADGANDLSNSIVNVKTSSQQKRVRSTTPLI